MAGDRPKPGIGTRLLALLSRLPLPLFHGLGAALGEGLAWLPNRARRISETNIGLCFPELERRARRRLVRRTLRETGKTALETPTLWLADGGRVLRMVKGATGKEAVDAAMNSGCGVILAGPHLGAWEMIGLYASAHWPITSLYRPPEQKAVEAMMHAGRERVGATLVPTDASGIRRLWAALKRGEMAGILPDQDPHDPDGTFAPFFGIAANTMTLLTRFAAKSGAPVFIAWAERLPWGRGYHIHFEPVPAAVADPDPETATAALNAAVEAAVRERPEQYQWAYKRFRTRPRGEVRIYRRAGDIDRRNPLAARLDRD
ncbi:MAG TPA: lysophospholipid acyltransferase family protein [Gammaproteobacteria bacterium]|nr:lysophospholipid acyltransferase family protein [Gammaproteobacteria bacterium]